MKHPSRGLRSRLAGVLALGALTVAAGALVPAVATAKPKPTKVKVMTRNLYLGANLVPALLAPNPPAVFRAAGDIWDEMQETNFTARARVLADEIAQTKPHLIGLQEVALWRRGPMDELPPATPTPAEEVVHDWLELLQHQLQKRGMNYRIAVVQQEADIELPVDRTDDSTMNPTFDGRLTMRDAILVRNLKRVRISNRQKGNFTAKISPMTAVGPVPVERGWNSVDVRFKQKQGFGKKFRFINTHLEAFHAYFRNQQARELVEPAFQGPGATSMPVILVGDLNSDPANDADETQPSPAPAKQSDAYNTVVGNGYADRGVTENTCCHDDDLLNAPPAAFYTRIDHVMTKGKVAKRNALLVGADAAMRTPTGLWPSDHGGVVSALTVR